MNMFRILSASVFLVAAACQQMTPETSLGLNSQIATLDAYQERLERLVATGQISQEEANRLRAEARRDFRQPMRPCTEAKIEQAEKRLPDVIPAAAKTRLVEIPKTDYVDSVSRQIYGCLSEKLRDNTLASISLGAIMVDLSQLTASGPVTNRSSPIAFFGVGERKAVSITSNPDGLDIYLLSQVIGRTDTDFLIRTKRLPDLSIGMSGQAVCQFAEMEKVSEDQVSISLFCNAIEANDRDS